MAASDKNILISPQRGSTTQVPSIVFTGDGNDPISLRVLDGVPGSLSFEGGAGQLFSLTDDLTSGSIFSVNDVSGLPSLDVNANGSVQIAPFGGTLAIGQSTVTSGQTVDIKGNLRVDGTLTVTSSANISSLSSTLLDAPNTKSRFLSLSLSDDRTLTYPGILNLGNIGYNYNFLNGTWSSSITAGIMAHCADQWEIAIHDSGTRVVSPFLFDGGSNHRLLMGRDIGWGTMPIEASNSFRAPIFYDSNDTAYYLDAASSTTSLSIAGAIEQGNNHAHPNIEWSASSNSTGMVIFSFPGGTGNYGMIHAVFDYYEYNSPRVATIIVGGHNWNGSWYNIACNVVGFIDKAVRVGVKDGKYCIVFGQAGSSWSYGTIRLRKIHNGSFYNNIMDLGGTYTAIQTTTESFTYISGDIRELRSSNTIIAPTLSATSNIDSPIYYDRDNTAYYLDPNSTTSIRTVGSWRSDSSSWDGEFSGKIQYHSNHWYIQGADLLIYRSSGGSNVFTVNQSGIVTASADFRAPIFYDNNNTAYYTDPASTSNLNSLTVNGTLNAYANPITVNRINFRTTSGGTSSDPYCLRFVENAGNDCWLELQLNDDSNEEFRIYGYSCNGYGCGEISGNLYHRFRSDGWAWHSDYVQGGNSVRGPIFYDSNDTGYYVDPASTSKLNVLNLVGRLGTDNPADYASTAITSLTSAPIDSYAQYDPSAGTSVIYYPMIHQTALYNSGYRTHTSYGLLKRSNAWDAAHYFAIGGNDSYPTESFFLNFGGSISHTQGFVTIDGSVRSPLLYDSNNTGYYVDPASTSYFNLIRGNNWLYLDQNYGHSIVGLYSASRYQGVFAMGDSYKLPADGTTTGNLYGIAWSHPNAGGVAGNLNTHGALIMENGTFLAALSGSIRSRDDMRTPIYYDNNDTGYYIDPNARRSTSINGFSARTKMTLGLTAKYQLDRADYTSDTNYWTGVMGWGTEDLNNVMTWGSGFFDTWSNPGNQPSGTSHWVGVQSYHYVNAANSGYGWQMCGGPIGNLRFRNSWPNNSSWKTIPVLDVNDNNGGAMYAGMYYDSNDTGYYVDPNSTTRLNVARFASGGYTKTYSFTPAGTKGSGNYVWVRASMGGFNSGGDSVRFSVTRSINDNGNDPYGGCTADFVAHSREWHGGQETCTVFYTQHGGAPYGAYITNAGPRDLAGGGYWFYMRVLQGVTYRVYVYSESGAMGDFDPASQTDPGSVPAVNTGFNILGSGGNSADIIAQSVSYGLASVRAPIFYDYNDTGYYIDPATTSLTNDLRANTYYNRGDTNSYLTANDLVLRGDNPTITLRDTDHNTGYIHVNSNIFYILRGANDAARGSWATTNGSWPLEINLTNNDAVFGRDVYAVSSMRSTIFYDTINTAYYLDPNSSTSLRTVGDWRADSSAWTGEFAGKIQYHSNNWYIQYQTEFIFRNASGVNTCYGNNVGDVWGGNSLRSPIYYDSGNTAFFIDAASNSNLNRTSTYLAGKDTNGDWATGFRNTPTSSYNFHGDISSGGPAGTWWFYESMRHSNSSSFWGLQIAWGWEDNANRLRTRNVQNNSFGAWVNYWNDVNDGSGSGLDADLLDGLNSTDFARVNSSSTFGVQTYFRTNLGTTSGAQASNAALTVYSTGDNCAFMSFRRESGPFGVNIGLDTDNVLRIGGGNMAANRWQLDSSGNMTVAGNVTAYSDIRLKDNIEVIDNALEKVLQLRGVTFTRTDVEDKERRHAGVIAQEVENVLPEVVQEQNDGMKSVAYSNMVGLLIEAIKEQQKMIEDLKSEINNLKK